MDLYTLNENFLAKDVVDEFVSAIWTERYSVVGEVQLVVDDSPENVIKLMEGTHLALRGSREIMTLQTQSIENGLLTVTGYTLPGFLNQRFAWFRNPGSSVDPQDRIQDYTETTTPGVFISHVVDKMVINPVAYTGEYDPVNLDWDMETIPGLSLGAIETGGSSERQTMPIGPLYDGIAQIADKAGLGFTIYLESADPIEGYSLKFTVYEGRDRTSTQTIRPVIRLTPQLDSISNLKEIHSIADYKNVCYVYYQGIVTKHLAEPSLPEPEGFDRRILVTNAEGDPVGHKIAYTGPTLGYNASGGLPISNYSNVVISPSDIAAFREQNARDALANHNYIRAIDGQASPQNDYKFGQDYGLGDIIELEGVTGLISRARITEYIRSEDTTGEKEYPTISVMPDA